MTKTTFTIDINAPKQHVWDVMLSDETYRQWTSAFHEGSYYDGNWEKGSTIWFLAEDDGQISGMSSKIADNIPNEFVSIEHLGEVIDGKEDLDSAASKQWAGAYENYTFSESGGVTTVTVDLISEYVNPEMSAMLNGMWPGALAKLKEIAEA